MACNCTQQGNIFKNSLNYSSPTHAGCSVVKTGHLVPESYQLFITPAGCGRESALDARIDGRKNRASYLFLTEEEIILGRYDEVIIKAADKLLKHLEKLRRKPKVLMIFVSCIDDLLGTDHDAIIQELSKLYLDVRFIFCHMNPISRGTSMPPDVNIQNKIHSLLDITNIHDNGVNIIGTLSPLRDNGELKEVLHQMNVSEVRHISNYSSFGSYQYMAKSKLNMVITPSGKYASEQMKEKHGIPYLMALTSFRIEEITKMYHNIADEFSVQCPDLTEYENRCRAILEETKMYLKDMPVIIDGEAIVRPFDLARQLLESAFNVQYIYAQKLLPTDKENFEWLQEHHPEVQILQPKDPKVTISERYGKGALAIGFRAAYLSGAQHVLDISDQHGLFGYQSIIDLMIMMKEASQKDVDLEKILEDEVSVV